jgi:hypothetical protein
MPSVSIHIHADSGPDFETTDPATIAAIRAYLAGFTPPESDRWLVPAHELAATLKTVGRKHWAAVLAHEEEAHVVTVVFGP